MNTATGVGHLKAQLARLARRRFLMQAAAGAAAALSWPVSAAETSGLRAMLLGTQGGPNFNLERGESASVLILDKRLILVDCGYGMLAALVKANLNYRDVSQVFLTHLHDDHVADVVSLMGGWPGDADDNPWSSRHATIGGRGHRLQPGQRAGPLGG